MFSRTASYFDIAAPSTAATAAWIDDNKRDIFAERRTLGSLPSSRPPFDAATLSKYRGVIFTCVRDTNVDIPPT